MGRPPWLMSGRTSGWENKRVTVWAPEDERFRNAAWALEMLVMTCGPILMSQAPLMRVRQQGIFGRRCAWCNATQEDSITIVRSEAKASCAMFVYVEAPDINDLFECVEVRVRRKIDSCHVVLPE